MKQILEHIDTFWAYVADWCVPVLLGIGFFCWWLTGINAYRQRIGVDEDSRKREVGDVHR